MQYKTGYYMADCYQGVFFYSDTLDIDIEVSRTDASLLEDLRALEGLVCFYVDDSDQDQEIMAIIDEEYEITYYPQSM